MAAKRLWWSILVLALGACLLWAAVSILFLGLRWVLAEEDWFLSFYEDYGTEERIGISPEDSAAAITAMIDYMEGSRESIQLTVTEYGRQVEMFNQQEIEHMVDVKNLYQGFKTGSVICLPLLGLALYAAYRTGRMARAVKQAALLALIAGAAAVTGLGAWVLTDFTSFWIKFHHVFFTNDLWLMDYATCRMIRICPEGIFYAIVLRMAGRAGAILAAAMGLWAGIWLLLSRRRGGAS